MQLQTLGQIKTRPLARDSGFQGLKVDFPSRNEGTKSLMRLCSTGHSRLSFTLELGHSGNPRPLA